MGKSEPCAKRGRRRKKKERERHQIEAQQDEGRSWKRARRQERHKDTGPLQYAARLHFSEPESLTEICTQPLHQLTI